MEHKFRKETRSKWKNMELSRHALLFALVTAKEHKKSIIEAPLTQLNANGSIPKRKASASRNVHEEIERHIKLHKQVRALKRSAIEEKIASSGTAKRED